MERNKRNNHLVCNEGDDVDNDSVDNGDDDDGAKGADKHLVHLSQAADCCRMDRNKRNKHLVCDEDDDVEYGDDDSVDDGDDDSVDDGAEGADNHLIHLSQAADCCKMERSEQNKCLVDDEDGDVEYGDDDSVEY
eukprot:9890199-Ditylum_brightwellii.AAC.1